MKKALQSMIKQDEKLARNKTLINFMQTFDPEKLSLQEMLAELIELKHHKNNAIFIPEGCAHGFQSLQDNCELLYIHSNNYKPLHERGIKWDDPIIKVSWPLNLAEISDRDNSFPYLEAI